ncbi:MAG: hypothetical protein ACK55Z_34015 [bacterium]
MTELYLGNNSISFTPPDFAQLTNLTVLSSSNISISVMSVCVAMDTAQHCRSVV